MAAGWRMDQRGQEMRDRDHYSCPEIRGDGALDQSSDSGDGGEGGKAYGFRNYF